MPVTAFTAVGFPSPAHFNDSKYPLIKKLCGIIKAKLDAAGMAYFVGLYQRVLIEPDVETYGAYVLAIICCAHRSPFASRRP